jgi:hypothetical protein
VGVAVFVTRVFLRFALVLRVAFFLIAMTASQFKVTLTGSRTAFNMIALPENSHVATTESHFGKTF